MDNLRVQYPRCCHPLTHILLHVILLTLLLLSLLPSPFSSYPSTTGLLSRISTLSYIIARQYASTDNPSLLAFLIDNSTSTTLVTPHTGRFTPDMADLLLSTDLSHPSRASHPLHTTLPSYDYCATPPLPLPYCEESATSEQYYQLTFFDRPGAGKRITPREGRPQHTNCIQLPPLGYRWPEKDPPLPCPVSHVSSCIHFPNLRVTALENLTAFNSGTPKNLYHFLSSYYDREQELIVRLAALHIPFGTAVRSMLDIGAGGGSIGLLLHRKYAVQTISTAFADWPYCEFIHERGGLCLYLDAMEPMPFAKFSFDVVHSGWVFHALEIAQLKVVMLEQHRLVRPGGWLWIQGGWSDEQVKIMSGLLVEGLGYDVRFEQRSLHDSSDGWTFDGTPFQLEWHFIAQRPISAHCGTQPRKAEGG